MKNRIIKSIAVFLILNIFLELTFPIVSLALTSGPSQPEVQSFQPVGTTELVDPFSGDFSYNIPLMDVGGYPVNLSYHSQISMDQESSWTGLGWNINPGVINRSMRGIPDDFDGSKGDAIIKEFNVKPNRTYGVNGAVKIEFLGLEKGFKKSEGSGDGVGSLSLGLGITYNNYKGFGFEQSISTGINLSKSAKGPLNAGLGVRSSSTDGLSITPSLSFSALSQKKDEYGIKGTLSTSFNSRTGLKTLNFDLAATYKPDYNIHGSRSQRYAELSNGGSTIDLGMPTYVPQLTLPFENASVAFSVKFGGAFFGLDAMYTIGGYYSQQKLIRSSTKVPAFGYFNSEKGMVDNRAMHDFNREKDGSFTQNTPRLPLTNYTFDVYSVSGQGIGGAYRPYRGDVGYMFDSEVKNTSNSYSLGLDLGAGNLGKMGADISVSDVYTRSNRWIDDNEAARNQKFAPRKNDDLYEPFYFKEAGEKSVDQDPYYASIGAVKPVRVELADMGGMRVAADKKLVGPETDLPLDNLIKRESRKKRNQNISFLTIKEAIDFSLQKDLYKGRNKVNTSKKHHIGEITALRPDGSRYIYGIPAYNLLQEEVSFSVGKSVSSGKISPDINTGLVRYDDGDNSVSNDHGIDNFFSNTKMGPYAHSYLLTAVLSPDYIDNDGVDGPSKGDMGTYTKFNYDKTISAYNWRAPMGTNQANSNEGLRSIDTDDQANYLYGKKEIWYLKSIETKNYVAIFETGDRADGLGVMDKNGEIDPTKKLKLLKKISLFLKSEYDLLTNDDNPTTSPVALKTVNFEYDYSSCPGIDNNILRLNASSLTDGNGFVNQGGKLTLKKVYFTYEKSEKGRFSPYVFNYSEFNPEYNPKAYDRWGNYKPLGASFRENAEFPYVEQNKTNADQYASAWNLTQVDLPSGGSIKVEYESDDYAYVQDKPAMQMFRLAGISNSSAYSTNTNLYGGGTHNLYLHLDLPKATTSEKFRDEYLKGIQNLYFKVSVNMDVSGSSYEYVPGYTEIEIQNSGVTEGKHAYIKLKPVSLREKSGKGKKVCPITFAALQFCRLYTPKYAFDEADATDGAVDQVLKTILASSFAKNITRTIMGPNNFLIAQGNCQDVELNKSFIRLLNPDKKKLGGGLRVKYLAIKDNASSLGMGDDTEYGQEFKYEVYDEVLKKYISSGVANYEPMIGGDENPFKEPIAFATNKQEKLLIPDDRFYVEKPLGESFFPSASVGYSRVTVYNRVPEGVKRHATGKTVQEFYTSKDFPVFTDNTDLKIVTKKSPMLLRLLKINVRDFMNASQGYVIELNDMHGKPKANWVYAEDQTTPISGVEYKYKTDPVNGKRLDNSMLTINSSGGLKEIPIGIDADFVLDMREEQTESKNIGAHINFESFLLSIFPLFVPLGFPAFGKEHTRFRSAVATKVINKYGLLEETIVHDLGSSLSTKNLALDSETGDVLLTETKNEFDDPIYNFTYPAHWAYEGMGQAYKNIGVEVLLKSLGSSLENNKLRVGFSTEHPEYFTEGDEIIFDQSSSGGVRPEDKKFRYWIVKKTGNEIIAIGGDPKEGCKVYPIGNSIVKIIRSGRKNMPSTPVGSISSLINPIVKKADGTYTFNITQDLKILNAGAQEFSDSWSGLHCNCGIVAGTTYNPFFMGTRGSYRPKKSYTYLTSRAYENTNRRKQGTFTSFDAFWKKPESADNKWAMNNTKWQFVNEVTAYDASGGIEMEDVDALGRPSSAQIGYHQTLPTGVSSNARRSEVLITNFEDYNMNSCVENLSEFKQGTLSDDAHSGKKSIKVSKGKKAKLEIIPGCR